MRKCKQGVSGTLKKDIDTRKISEKIFLFSVPLTPCLHLRIKKYINIKETPRAVPCEALAGSSSTGAGVLGQNGVNLTKMLASMLQTFWPRTYESGRTVVQKLT
jgi:hypothetical protein